MAQATIAHVVVPKGGIVHELRATLVVWQRELIRFQRDPARIVSSVVQPLLFLFVLGGGLGALVQAGTGGVDFIEFFGLGLGHLDAALGDDAQAGVFDHRVHLAGEVPLGGVGLDDRESAFGHGL